MTNAEIKSDYINKAQTIFEGNLLQGHSDWRDIDFRFISPAAKEYVYQWLWDTAFHAIVLTHIDLNWAKSEIKQHLAGQWDDGFIPHIIFWRGNTTNLPHWAFIESKRSLRPQTSAITQPPALALAVERIYQKEADKEFLKNVLPKLARHHRWLLENRDPGEDGLISVTSPNESGMDELPVFQNVAGYPGQNTARLHFTYRRGDLFNNYYNFDSKKILEKDYFNCEELVFNTVYIEATRALGKLFAEINDKEEAKFFTDQANRSESALLEKCWNQEEKIFYSLYSKSEKQAKVKTVASIIPLFLEGLKGEKLDLLVKDHVLNPQEFWTKFPIPSVAANEPYYEPKEIPKYKIKLLWRGPTWVNTNWFVVKGLRKHGYKEEADHVVRQMLKMIQNHGFREYYNPETGEGYRRENFGWSTLIVDLL